ncbi:LysM domain-containing protein [Sphingomonas sp. Y38-1Y]|uniref:LysM peptidoglycan-binding domain-containing protein n=1 Tax=Sphingomonas sp. Y38-1Y TaxID=3078265 RepID=UPI0028E83CDB|nr:LysM domain-containing protein [Sphingomonas sp. Y38-1Y]
MSVRIGGAGALALALSACGGGPRPAPTPPPATSIAAEVDAIAAMLDRGEVKPARKRLAAALKREPMNPSLQLLRDSIERDPVELLGPQSYAYTVRGGDTMAGIAARLLGNRLKAYQLARYNKVENPSTLTVGTVLRIPGQPPRAPAPTPPPRRADPAPARPAPAPVAKPKPAAPPRPSSTRPRPLAPAAPGSPRSTRARRPRRWSCFAAPPRSIPATRRLAAISPAPNASPRRFARVGKTI